jgi:hypothetical protein
MGMGDIAGVQGVVAFEDPFDCCPTISELA